MRFGGNMVHMSFSRRILFAFLAAVCLIFPITGIYSSKAQDNDNPTLTYEQLLKLLEQYANTDSSEATDSSETDSSETNSSEPVAISEAEKAFDNTLESLRKEGRIPAAGGSSTYWGDYEDEWAQLGWYQWITFENSNHFVFSANVSWASASQTPNNFESGCGLIYNIGNGNSNHLMASIRMDGLVYFTGFRNNNYLSYGTYKYGKASTSGSADFVVVVDNDKATVYIDGQRIVQKAELPVMGNGVGLCTLSGTNKDFGTRCTWKDIYVYTW